MKDKQFNLAMVARFLPRLHLLSAENWCFRITINTKWHQFTHMCVVLDYGLEDKQ
jgi:hypothetical protein